MVGRDFPLGSVRLQDGWGPCVWAAQPPLAQLMASAPSQLHTGLDDPLTPALASRTECVSPPISKQKDSFPRSYELFGQVHSAVALAESTGRGEDLEPATLPSRWDPPPPSSPTGLWGAVGLASYGASACPQPVSGLWEVPLV